ncbi:MAG: bifunctional metallophosphatase/5'-nucleotidase [Armatimonadota bacterium]
MQRLVILHTNDLHGKLSRKAADVIAREKASNPNTLLLDAGDAVTSGNIYYRPGGEPVLAKLSDLSYDAMAMGNREFHFLGAGLRSKVKLARFPVLSANIRSSVDIGPTVMPSISKTINDIKVTIFGLTVPMITKRMTASKFSPFWFDDPVNTAKEIVPSLRADCDILIALTHIGLQNDLELARSVDGIDLIVGGHTHAVLREPRIECNTTIVQAGWWGHYLGNVEIDIDSSGISKIQGQLINIKAQ